MAIVRRPAGLTRSMGELAILAGEAKAATRAADRQERMASEIRRIKAQKEMRSFNAELDLEAERRARAWEVEKMETRSRLDFEREERRRIQEEDEKESKIKSLQNALERGQITEADYSNAVLSVQLGYRFQSPKVRGRGSGGMEDIYRQLMSGEPIDSVQEVSPTGPNELIPVIHRATGQAGRVPRHEFDESVYAKRVN